MVEEQWEQENDSITSFINLFIPINSDLLIDGATETVKQKIKIKQEGRVIPALMTPIDVLLIAPMA